MWQNLYYAWSKPPRERTEWSPISRSLPGGRAETYRKCPFGRQRLFEGKFASSKSDYSQEHRSIAGKNLHTLLTKVGFYATCGRCTWRVKKMFSVYNELHTRDILPQWKCPKLASSDCQALEMGLVWLRKAINISRPLRMVSSYQWHHTSSEYQFLKRNGRSLLPNHWAAASNLRHLGEGMQHRAW